MSKGVNKHCSILNYIRHADNELYELVQDLCIGRIFVPRRGSPGITFLRPDKSLLKEIQKMASGENPEDAVEAIQSLVLLDNISSLREFDDKRSDIPTFLRKKLPVASADSKKVTLKNGAEIVPDQDFMSRGDRPNISVYIISKQLVPADTEAADFSNAKIKEKKGGADLGELGHYNKQHVFNQVLQATYSNSREPAMELLVAMHNWASSSGNSDLAELIASQASYDAVATLAIVLQPLKTEGFIYINDATWQAFKTAVYGHNADDNTEYKNIPDLYSFDPNVKEKYDALVKASHPQANTIQAAIEQISIRVGRPSIVPSLGRFYQSIKSNIPLGKLRDNLSPKEHFAEAELRVISAVLIDNNADYDASASWFNKLTLERPYLCDDRDVTNNSNIGVYFSTVYLIARSNALLYVPGIANNSEFGLDSIANEGVVLNLNRGGNIADRAARRMASQEAIANRRKLLANAF